jgi:hypothetical protein
LEIDPELEKKFEREAEANKVEQKRKNEEKKAAERKKLKDKEEKLKAEKALAEKREKEKREEARRAEIQRVADEAKKLADKNREAELKLKPEAKPVEASGTIGRSGGQSKNKIPSQKGMSVGNSPAKEHVGSAPQNKSCPEDLDDSLGYYRNPQTFIITTKKLDCLGSLHRCNPKAQGGVKCLWRGKVISSFSSKVKSYKAGE